MVDFIDNYTTNAKRINISNEASGWNKKIQKPQLRGGVYHFKCNCDLTNGLQDDCRNPNCRSSYTKLTKRTCSCGRSLLKKSSENLKKEEKKKDVGDGDNRSGEAKVSKKPKEKEVKEPPEKEPKEQEVKEVKPKESKEKEVKEIKPKESKEKEVKEVKAKESDEKEVKEVKAKKLKEPEKENKKPKEKEPILLKSMKGKEYTRQIIKKKPSIRI